MKEIEFKPQTKTQIIFDLSEVLTAEELTKFQESAEKAGAASLTEHFLNLTLRSTEGRAA